MYLYIATRCCEVCKIDYGASYCSRHTDEQKVASQISGIEEL
jgi:hypothetical protein